MQREIKSRLAGNVLATNSLIPRMCYAKRVVLPAFMKVEYDDVIKNYGPVRVD